MSQKSIKQVRNICTISQNSARQHYLYLYGQPCPDEIHAPAGQGSYAYITHHAKHLRGVLVLLRPRSLPLSRRGPALVLLSSLPSRLCYTGRRRGGRGPALLCSTRYRRRSCRRGWLPLASLRSLLPTRRSILRSIRIPVKATRTPVHTVKI